jgi:hypothetical protein
MGIMFSTRDFGIVQFGLDITMYYTITMLYFML